MPNYSLKVLAAMLACIPATPTFKQLGFVGGNIAPSSSSNAAYLYTNAAFDNRGWGKPGSNLGPVYVRNAVLTFSAASGAGVAVSSTTSSAFTINGSLVTVGNYVVVDQWKYCKITAVTDSQHITVTITGTLSRSTPTTIVGYYYATIIIGADGWPVQGIGQTCEQVVGATGFIVNGVQQDGLLARSSLTPDGVYHGKFTSSAGATATVGGNGGAGPPTMSNIVTASGTTTFDLNVPAGTSVIFQFTEGVSDFNIPRDGSHPTTDVPTFSPVALAYYSQLSIIRVMDMTLVNSSFVTDWRDRPFNFTGCPQAPYSWETLIDLANATYTYAGSAFKKWWINLPSFADPTLYAMPLAQLLNSRSLNPSIILIPEVSNEPWNNSFQQWAAMINLVLAEGQIITNYALGSSIVTSVVSDGLTPSTLTVTLSSPLSNLPYITTGAPCIASDLSLATRSTVTPGQAGYPATVTVTGANTFTYPVAGTVSAGASFVNNSTQWNIAFNITSNLVADNVTYNTFNLYLKWNIRQAYLIKQAWLGYRTSDRFVLNLKEYGGAAANGLGSFPSEFAYANWLSSTFYGTGPLSSWVYGIAKATYMQPVSPCTVAGSITAGVLNVTAVTVGTVQTGRNLFAANITAGTTITSQLTGTTGGIGTYQTSGTQTLGSQGIVIFNTDDIFAQFGTQSPQGTFTGILQTHDWQNRAHAYACALYGVTPMLYEYSPDLGFAGYQLTYEIMSDPRMQTVTKNMMDSAFQNGIQDSCAYTMTPAYWIDTQGADNNGYWPALENFADTASPKAAAVLTYATPRKYVNNNGSPGVLTNTFYQRSSGTGVQPPAGNGMIIWTVTSSLRTVGYAAAINTAGTYTITLYGSDTAATAAQIWVDGVQAGTSHLPANGSGASGGTVPGPVLDPVAVHLGLGTHAIEVRFPANTGASPGVFKFTVA